MIGLSALVGCASSGGIQHAGPIATHTPVSIDFARVETSSALGDLEPEKHSLNDLVISGLRARDVFGDVEGDEPAAGASGGMDIKIDYKGNQENFSRGTGMGRCLGWPRANHGWSHRV